jgi:hypothetical protein
MKDVTHAFAKRYTFDPDVTFDQTTSIISVKGPTPQQVSNELMLRFAADLEGKLRAALIEMGWTPPPEEKT